jgi:hypothetical protein
MRTYSNRPELLVDLDQAARRLERALRTDPLGERISVRSTGRVGRVWALGKRLEPSDVQTMAEEFSAGTRCGCRERSVGTAHLAVAPRHSDRIPVPDPVLRCCRSNTDPCLAYNRSRIHRTVPHHTH